jgi:HEAT repeat protein
VARLSTIANPRTRISELEHRLEQGDVLVLFEGLGDPYPPLRTIAARELAHHLEPGFEAYLRALVRGDEGFTEAAEIGLAADDFLEATPSVRSAACVALQSSESPATVAVLLDAARSADADLRYHALVTLHHLPVPQGQLRPLVEERLSDEDPEIAIVAAQIAAHEGWHALLDVLERLWRRLKGRGDLQVVFAIAELIPHARKAGAQVPQSVVDAVVEQCMAALSDEVTTAAASHALALLGDARATQALEEVLDKWIAHPILKVGAAAALVELGHERGARYLADMLHSRRKDARGYAIRIVGRLRLRRHFDDLVALAGSDDYHADTAVLALNDFGGDEAYTALKRIAGSHPDGEVRELAEQCLHGDNSPL